MKKTNLIKRILAYTLVLSVVFSQMIFSPSAATTNVAVWDGTKAESFAGGDGTAANPFLIETAEQLYKMVVEYSNKDASLNKYFKITNDIYLNDVKNGNPVKDLENKNNWLAGYEDGTIATPTATNSFYGTLDGDGNTIYGLYAVADNKALGLFPAITNGTVIKNLNFDNVYINGKDSDGGVIAGNAIYYNWQYRAQITNCSVINAQVGEKDALGNKMEFAAGFVGDAQNVKFTFTNCYTYNSTFVDWSTGAGIVANDWNSGDIIINDCYSAGVYPVRASINMAVVTNTYTNVSAPEGNVTENITTLTDNQMKGEAAKANMAGYDFAYVWKTVENGYPVLRDEIIPVWDGSKDYNFEGTGTENDPYLIKTAAQLAAIATGSNGGVLTGKYFKLANDIRINNTFSANWKESARNWLWADFRFIGTFDGDGHTIDGLYYEGDQRVMGLFSYVGADNNGTYKTTLKNFNMTNAYIESTAADGAGFVAGQASRVAYFDGIYIDETCEINSTVKGAGGILGQSSYNVFMSNIAMNGKVVGGSNVGAFVGTLSSGAKLDIKSSYTSADLYAQGVTDRNLASDSANVYVVKKQGTVDAVATQLSLEQMKGEAAKTNMKGLSFRYVWEVVENGFPVYNPRGEIWDGTVATSYAEFKGSGTAEDPYLIENGAQLAFATVKDSKINSGYHFKLANDIVLNDASYEGWQSTARPWLQNTSVRFIGTFDGDGHTIEGLYFNSSVARMGLFAYIGGSVVKNVKFTGASINNTSESSVEGIAIVAGQTSGATTFENIYVDETCEINAPNAKGVAAIVGRGYNNGQAANPTIKNCAVLANINGASHVGAFTGTYWAADVVISIDNSFSASNVGMVGANSGVTTITNSYTNVLGSKDNGAVQVDSANMKGENAKTNMPMLDFACTWQTVENGYPVLRENILAGWDGTAATEFAGGTGTQADPFLIENGAELYKMVAEYSNADVTVKPETQTYFKITKDINLGNKQWYTHKIYSDNLTNGNYKTGFNGVVYGDGHTIYGLTVIGTSSYSSVGLIPVATQGTEIYDLHLESGKLTQTAWNGRAVGAFIGLAVGTENSQPIVIEKCSVKDFDIESENGSAAFVAYSYSQSVTIRDSYCVETSISNTGTDADSSSGAFIAVMKGNEWGNNFVIENSHCADATPTILANDKFKAKTTFENVYTSNEDYDGSIDGLTKLTVAEMTGAAARENLDGFNFNQIWKCGAEGEYPVHKTAEENANIWNGTIAEDFAGGEGTAEKPFEISNAEELFLLAKLDTKSTAGKYYKLTSDINVSNVYEGWETDSPYSWAKKTAYLDGFTYANSFAGTLDGAGYTVSGLYYADEITDNGNYAYGLIPFVSADAIIKNINVTDVASNVKATSGKAYVGAVAGVSHVTEEDIANAFKMVQFVGVNAKNSDVAILGGASRGVKFELCNADKFIGSASKNISIRNCNSNIAYTDDILIYNSKNADSTTLANTRKILLGTEDKYITDINGDEVFNLKDLVSAKKGLVMSEKPDNEYKLAWSQDFSGDSIDYSVWSKNTTMNQKSNLIYADNATVSNDSLNLACKYTGEVDENGNKIYSVNYGLSTVDTMSFKYGKIEMRAKIPFGAGAFPSLWLTSRNALNNNGAMPYDAEIDIFEVFGKTASQDRIITCIHKWYNDETGARTGDECSCGSGILAGNGYKVEESDRSYAVTDAGKTDWHTITFEWSEDTMTFAVDGTVYYTAKLSDMDRFDIFGYETDSSLLFNQPMYLRVSNHMHTPGGESYVYEGNDSEIDASKLNYEIDYIRLYQKNDGKSEINLK